jgi:hypothetical protein
LIIAILPLKLRGEWCELFDLALVDVVDQASIHAPQHEA